MLQHTFLFYPHNNKIIGIKVPSDETFEGEWANPITLYEAKSNLFDFECFRPEECDCNKKKIVCFAHSDEETKIFQFTPCATGGVSTGDSWDIQLHPDTYEHDLTIIEDFLLVDSLMITKRKRDIN